MANKPETATVTLSDGTEAVFSLLADPDEQQQFFAADVFHAHDALAGMKTLLGDIKDGIHDLGIKGGTVECSIGFTVKEGKLVSVLASGSMSGTLTITLDL